MAQSEIKQEQEMEENIHESSFDEDREASNEEQGDIRARELKGLRRKRVKEEENPSPIDKNTPQLLSLGFKRTKLEEADQDLRNLLEREKRYSRSLEQKNSRLLLLILEYFDAERIKEKKENEMQANEELGDLAEQEKRKHLNAQYDLGIMEEENARLKELLEAQGAELAALKGSMQEISKLAKDAKI